MEDGARARARRAWGYFTPGVGGLARVVVFLMRKAGREI
jgi:hypothetical protein